MQKGFYFDQARCTGCFACAVACKDWHDTPAGPANWMRIHYREEGNYPNLFVSHVAAPCYHCSEPVCAFVCPNEALTKRDEDGIVVVDRDKCRGDEVCGIIDESKLGGDHHYGESTAPCQAACPAGLQIPAYIALIAKGKNKEALELIRRHMPLPSICGRICLHPCETACRRQDVEEPVAIMSLKGFVTDSVPYEAPQKIMPTQDRKVAVIGSGPAGLGAAYDLIRMGYGVTVFEALAVVGGMLAVGGPEYRLPRDVLQRDLDYIEALGVEIKTDTAIDLGKGLDDLLSQDYGAVLLALGAHKGQKLNIPGSDLAGNMVGTSFLRDVNLGEATKIGKRVLVVGGGNVALDCARSAIRLGAEEVRIACLEGRTQDMPADREDTAHAADEGVQFQLGVSLSRVIEEGGKVAGVECVDVTNLEFDEDGRPSFDTVADSEKTLAADTVVFAIGQVPDLASLPANGEIASDAQGTIAADPEVMMTGRRGIFAAGDSFDAAGSIVEAISSGQKAAFYINRFLQGDVLRVRSENIVEEADIKVEIPANIEKQPRQPMPLLPAAERTSNWKEVILGFDADSAVAEAKRCLNCAGHLCKDACPYSAPQFAIEEKAKMQKCDLCYDRWDEDKKPICVEACPPRALDAGPIAELAGKYGGIKDAVGFVYSSVIEPSIVNKPKKRP
ncbi:MAG: FAD-dependent oxidoreductase [Proteobacteria bacterium]|nr:FAD-dependent oxidoreductase [Pseudomonadota bacterium]